MTPACLQLNGDLCLADGCCYFVHVGLSSSTSRGGKQVGAGELKLKHTLNSVGGKAD